MTIACEPLAPATSAQLNSSRRCEDTSRSESEQTESLFDAMKRAESFEEYCSIRNQILLAHLPVIRRLARRLARNVSSQADLESEGAHEMLTAISRFKPDDGAPFQAYAIVCIRGRMLDSLTATDGMGIAGKAARNLRRLRATLATSADSCPIGGPKSLSDASGVPSRAIRRLRPFVDQVSLDAPANPTSSDSPSIGEISLLDPTLTNEPAGASDCLQLNEDLSILGRCLRGMPGKDRFVLERLYGLGDRTPLTQTELAGIMGISRQRVSQITSRALKRIKADGWSGP